MQYTRGYHWRLLCQRDSPQTRRTNTWAAPKFVFKFLFPGLRNYVQLGCGWDEKWLISFIYLRQWGLAASSYVLNLWVIIAALIRPIIPYQTAVYVEFLYNIKSSNSKLRSNTISLSAITIIIRINFIINFKFFINPLKILLKWGSLLFEKLLPIFQKKEMILLEMDPHSPWCLKIVLRY